MSVIHVYCSGTGTVSIQFVATLYLYGFITVLQKLKTNSGEMGYGQVVR